jgi:phage shock protein PspC (stress-responsive transcriptional regulator)
VTLTRVIAVVLAIMVFPIGLLAYGLLWLMMPEEQLVLPATTHLDPAS